MNDYPEWLPDDFDTAGLDSASRYSGQLVVRASQIAKEEVQWLWPGRLAIGKITILDGDPDVGKSTITCEIAAALTSRAYLPGGHCLEREVGVVLVNAEDSAADTIKPRLEAAGADLDRCFVVTPKNGRMLLPHDLHLLDNSVKEVGAKLVVIDPLFAHLPPGKNSWNDQHMREVLSPVKAWAERMRVAVLLIRHPNKGKDMKAMYRGGGSIGIIGAARFGLFAAEHPSDPDVRVLASSKCNIGRKPSSLGYRIVESADDPEIGVVEWEGEINVTANDLVGYGRPTRDRQRDKAERFLVDLLRDRSLPMIEAEAKALAAGFSKSTVGRAKATTSH